MGSNELSIARKSDLRSPLLVHRDGGVAGEAEFARVAAVLTGRDRAFYVFRS
jgi:hypothetical protein